MRKLTGMKRAAGLLMAVMMTVMMAVPVMADTTDTTDTQQTGTATISIKNPTLGETYTLYKVFDATVNPDNSVDKDRNIAYSLNLTAEQKEEFNKNEFFKIDDAGNITATDNAYAKDEDNNPIKDRLSSGAIDWIKSNGTKISELKPTTADDLTNGDLVFGSLPYGYYYVSSTLKKDGQSEPAITVTSTNPNGIIIDKNQGPTWTPDPDPEKPNENIGKMIVVKGEGDTETLVDTNSLNFGESVEFQISIDATNYNGEKQIKKYYVIDKLQTGFTFDEITSVKIIKDTGDTVDLTSKYSLQEEDLESVTIGTGEDAKTYKRFVLEFDWADESENVWTNKYPANSKIVIRYKATLNENGVIAEDGNENRAKFAYIYTDMDEPEDPDPENPDPENPIPSVEEEVTTTYTYALAIRKVDKEASGDGSAKGLANAYFTVASPLAPQIPLSFKEIGENTGVYNYVASGTEGSVTEVVSPAGGIIIIKGVKGNLAKGEFEYILTETKAPAGYNKLTAPVKVPVQVDTTYEKKVTTYFKDETKKEVVNEVTEYNEEKSEIPCEVTDVVVINNKGVLLPSTGGMGTTMIYIIGGILVLGAGVLLVTKKRMGSR